MLSSEVPEGLAVVWRKVPHRCPCKQTLQGMFSDIEGHVKRGECPEDAGIDGTLIIRITDQV